MSVTIGWWAIPAAITVAVIVYGLWPSRCPGMYGDVAGAFLFLVGLCVCLAAWLVWSLVA